ncbi:hypothetical protein B5K10_24120 [Rhizobium leguminosarum bv. trifolii]|uniref:Uncharacterized protein n=2 Tax=Rhizobium TaxID=379 RepID=A0A3E1B690_RHILT|nr:MULTISPECIES: hypothetical protein [Rhizobium]QAS80950.1 hypothetical protein CO657_23355 [Rhizobium acidisoli]RFB86655.1 hypothetical protein B5K10_24120 [Rhizobium leguminosarum bv. trifolii]
MKARPQGLWYGRGPKGSESYGGGCVATTTTYQDINFKAIADVRSHSSEISYDQAAATREFIAACNPENIAILISAYKEMQQKLVAHGLAG